MRSLLTRVAMACLLTVPVIGLTGCDVCEPTPACIHVRDGRVALEECSYGTTLYDPNIDQIDNNDIDPRDDRDPKRAYFATRADYTKTTICE